MRAMSIQSPPANKVKWDEHIDLALICSGGIHEFIVADAAAAVVPKGRLGFPSMKQQREVVIKRIFGASATISKDKCWGFCEFCRNSAIKL